MSTEPREQTEDFLLAARRVALELLEESAMEEQGHPDVDELVAYHEDRLEAAEAERIRAHVEACGQCREELEGLEALSLEEPDAPEMLPGPEIVAADWEKLQRRLRQQSEPEGRRDSDEGHGREDSTVVTPSWGRSWGPWGMGLLAASLLMAAVGATAWLSGLWEPWGSDQDKPPVVADFQHPFLTDLVADGEELQRSAGAQAVTPPSGADLLIFRLLLGDLTSYPSYQAEIRDASGRMVWSHKHVIRQPTGTFVVLVPRSHLPPGGYRLVLEAGEPGDEQPLATYSFEISTAD